MACYGYGVLWKDDEHRRAYCIARTILLALQREAQALDVCLALDPP